MNSEIGEWVESNPNLVACFYCSHIVEGSGKYFCENKESPHYWNNDSVKQIDWNKDPDEISEPDGIKLTLRRLRIGCEYLDFDTEPLPEHIFRSLPRGSFLRRRKYVKQ